MVGNRSRKPGHRDERWAFDSSAFRQTYRGINMSQSPESRLARIRFSTCIPGCDRMHYVTAEDVRVVLGRLPAELWQRLRVVHFNDRSRGARVLGYVNMGRRDIGLCALPPRGRFGRSHPARFVAMPGLAWPKLAVRRY